MSVVVAPCSYAEAKQAVTDWHYSHTLPAAVGANNRFGVYEDSQWLGVVLFGTGANRHIGSPYGLQSQEVRELIRVALREHTCAVSQVVAEAIRQLKELTPSCRLIVSYADTNQGHLGKIYQAGNWIYTGESKTENLYLVDGVYLHARTVFDLYGTNSVKKLKEQFAMTVTKSGNWPKHKYLYPLDKQMARKIRKLALPYPRDLSSEKFAA